MNDDWIKVDDGYFRADEIAAVIKPSQSEPMVQVLLRGNPTVFRTRRDNLEGLLIAVGAIEGPPPDENCA